MRQLHIEVVATEKSGSVAFVVLFLMIELQCSSATFALPHYEGLFCSERDEGITDDIYLFSGSVHIDIFQTISQFS